VASVLSMQPRIVLLDEPTSGQDRRNIKGFMEHLKTLSGEGITSVFITHDMETALEFAHRIIILDHGTILADGKPATIFADGDTIAQTSLKPPQTMALCAGLGLSPSFCVAELADRIRRGDGPWLM
jgi:energy-coupling factor transporter ATP-binding protein EcfA2